MSKGTIVQLRQEERKEQKKAGPWIQELFQDQYGEPYAKIRDVDGTIKVIEAAVETALGRTIM